MDRLVVIPVLTAMLIAPCVAAGISEATVGAGLAATGVAQAPALTADASPGSTGDNFPSQLLGTWDLGPRPCRLPVRDDSDSPIRIEVGVLRGYEHLETPLKVEQVSASPAAWRVESAETYLGSQTSAEVRIFVADGDSLVITDGATVQHYMKCR